MIRAAIFGCQGTRLEPQERQFFAETNPLGFILFGRNCQTPDQVRHLVDDLRDCVGRADAPVLIDQEGGRVQRLKPPHWRDAPAAALFSRLAENDLDRAIEAARLNASLIARELFDLGITVDCAPVADVLQVNADPIIGDRSYGLDPVIVTALAGAVCDGLLDGGVLPVVKHIPGHGRADVDSHLKLPVVSASMADLQETDFAPFAALASRPWAMTAHVIYQAIDGDCPATTSAKVIDVIRDQIGFTGILLSDDLSMQALSGDMARRTRDCLAAGCDVVLHCNGKMDEIVAVAGACSALSDSAAARIDRGEALRRDQLVTEQQAPVEAVRRLQLLLEGKD